MRVIPAAVAAIAARVAAHAVRTLRGRDLALWAAGLTFFAGLAIVPMLLLALRGAAMLFGPKLVTGGARRLGESLPDAHDATTALTGLADAAVHASWPVLLAALLPATLYGEGLRRGLRQIADEPVGKWAGWAGRLGFLPVLAAAPLLVALPLAVTPVVGPWYAAGGWWTVLGVVVSFHVDLVPVCATVAAVFALAGPVALGVRTVLVAGCAVGAVLTGFLHGFVLFLAIPVDWSVPFGGLPVVGAVAALALWFFTLHAVLLLGYRATLSAHTVLETRNGRNHHGAAPQSDRQAARPLARRGPAAAVGPAEVDEAGTDVRRGETGGDRGGGEAGGGATVGQLVRPGREPRGPR